MANEMIERRGFLKSLGLCLGVIAGADTAITAQQELQRAGLQYELMRFRVRNFFTESNKTRRVVSFSILTIGELSNEQMQDWIRDNPLTQFIHPPRGFVVSMTDFRVDKTGRELAASIEMIQR